MLESNHILAINIFSLVAYLLIAAITILGLGLFISVSLVKKGIIKGYYAVIFSCFLAALIGYIIFFLSLASPAMGHIFSVAICISSFAGLGIALYNGALRPILTRRIIIFPLSLMLLTAVFYSSILFSCVNKSAEPLFYCYLPAKQVQGYGIVTFDNLIPYYFANNVNSHDAKKGYGDWKSSDRPPLQTGIYLAFSPVLRAFTSPLASYQLISMLLQLFSIPALYALLKSLRIDDRKISYALFSLVITGFIFASTFYVWPKLLAASLCLYGLAIFINKNSKSTNTEVVIGGLVLGLSLMAHAGVLFTILPLLLYLFIRPRNTSPRSMCLMFLSIVAILAPWLWYSKIYDPPGDRLVKWHFAGVVPITEDSATHAVIHAYKHLTPSKYITNKVENVDTIITGKVNGQPQPPGVIKPLLFQNQQMYSLVFALSALNIAWLGFFKWKTFTAKDKKNVKTLAFMAGISIIFWVLLMFSPNSTLLFQGSYAIVPLVIIILATVLDYLSKKVVMTILLMQAIIFFVSWQINQYVVYEPVINWAMVGLSILSFILITLLVFNKLHFKNLLNRFLIVAARQPFL
jgi:4-amino-4-deoxy-L-arabinose transferase-like glycosyltransferase